MKTFYYIYAISSITKEPFGVMIKEKRLQLWVDSLSHRKISIGTVIARSHREANNMLYSGFDLT